MCSIVLKSTFKIFSYNKKLKKIILILISKTTECEWDLEVIVISDLE